VLLRGEALRVQQKHKFWSWKLEGAKVCHRNSFQTLVGLPTEAMVKGRMPVQGVSLMWLKDVMEVIINSLCMLFWKAIHIFGLQTDLLVGLLLACS
jgi:hypothetical protein